MTHTLILAGNADALHGSDSASIQAIDSAAKNRNRRLADRRAVSAASTVAQVTLILIVLLTLAHSGYWALLLPSWLTVVAFVSGAGGSAGYEHLRADAQGGSV